MTPTLRLQLSLVFPVFDEEENIGLPARIELTLTLELSPRIGREQIRIQSVERRTQVYKRVIRLPETLRVEEDQLVVLQVPSPPTQGAATAPTGGDGTGGTDATPITGEDGGVHVEVGTGQGRGGGTGQSAQTILEGG